MAKNRHSRNHNNHRRAASSPLSPTRSLVRPPAPSERQATVFGKAFIVLEDADKNTFFYQGGSWVPFSASIAECRQSCQVKELPQKLNRMTRYEVRLPA